MVWSSRTSCNASRTSSRVAENSLVIPGPNRRSLEGEPRREWGERKAASRSSTRGTEATLVRECRTLTTSRVPPLFRPMLFVPSGSRPETCSPAICSASGAAYSYYCNSLRAVKSRATRLDVRPTPDLDAEFRQDEFCRRTQTPLAGLQLIRFRGRVDKRSEK